MAPVNPFAESAGTKPFLAAFLTTGWVVFLGSGRGKRSRLHRYDSSRNYGFSAGGVLQLGELPRPQIEPLIQALVLKLGSGPKSCGIFPNTT